jgi:hypothetical protein
MRWAWAEAPVVQVLKIFPVLYSMKPEGLSPRSQVTSTGPQPEPNQFSPYHPILALQDPS